MVRRQIPTALLLSTLLALGATASALAKDDAIVTLDSSLPMDPEPGSEITVGWTVETPVDGATPAPFNAEGMFVRLIPTTGDPVEAVGRQDRLGHYVATVTVPEGGLGSVEFGLRGESCVAGVCERSDLMFVIGDPDLQRADPAAAVPHAGVGAPSDESVGSTAAGIGSLPLGIVGLLIAAGAIIVALGFMRARDRPLTPGSSRS